MTFATKDGPVLIVNGGSRGIGAATAKTRRRAGLARDDDLSRPGRRRRGSRRRDPASGGEAATMQAEIADEFAVKRMFDVAEETFGKVTGLVNNAGVDGGPRPLAR